MNEEALAVLRTSQPKVWRGRDTSSWVGKVYPTYQGVLLNKSSLTREDLQRLISNEDLTPEEQFLAIAAWGGMRYDHGRDALTAVTVWKNILIRLQKERGTRADAFDFFHQARLHKTIPSLGAAYYTKLIFFLQPERKGLIMDQWVSRSINLLCGKTVELQNGWVTDQNDKNVYERFCQHIESVADALGKDPSETERLLFSSGGRNPGEWRLYVKLHTH